MLGDSLRHKSSRASELTQLIDWQDTITDKFCLGSRKVGEYQSRAIAQDDLLGEMDGLEVLCLSRSRGDRYLLCTDEGVNSRRLSDVRVSNKSNLCLP